MNEPPPDPRTVRPDLPEAVAALVATAMAKDPAARFPTPVAFKAAITDVQRVLGGTAVTHLPWQPPAENASLLGPFADGGWRWLAAQLAGTLTLPLLLNPLLRINPGYTPSGFGDPGWWARWMGLGLLSAFLLWTPLRLRQRPQLGRGWAMPTLVAGVIITATLIIGTGQALVSAADAAPGWMTLVWILGLAAGLTSIVLTLRRWNALDADTVLRRAFLPPLQVALVVLPILLITHLTVAPGPRPAPCARTAWPVSWAGCAANRNGTPRCRACCTPPCPWPSAWWRRPSWRCAAGGGDVHGIRTATVLSSGLRSIRRFQGSMPARAGRSLTMTVAEPLPERTGRFSSSRGASSPSSSAAAKTPMSMGMARGTSRSTPVASAWNWVAVQASSTFQVPSDKASAMAAVMRRSHRVMVVN